MSAPDTAVELDPEVVGSPIGNTRSGAIHAENDNLQSIAEDVADPTARIQSAYVAELGTKGCSAQASQYVQELLASVGKEQRAARATDPMEIAKAEAIKALTNNDNTRTAIGPMTAGVINRGSGDISR